MPEQEYGLVERKVWIEEDDGGGDGRRGEKKSKEGLIKTMAKTVVYIRGRPGHPARQVAHSNSKSPH